MKASRRIAGVTLLCVWALSATSWAQPVSETVTRINVTTKDFYGRRSEGYNVVTIFKPAGEGPFPVVMINHGRPGDAARATWERVKYSEISTMLVARGFVVVLPTRMGYGSNTASGDPEDEISCTRATPQGYMASFNAAADQIEQAAAWAQTLPYVQPGQVYVIGISVGGAAVVAAGARPIPGVKAIVNFAGGIGGKPSSNPGEPCSGPSLESSFSSFGGAHGTIPELWLYTENDEFFGPRVSKRMYEGFTKAGGKAEFKMMPAWKDKGHGWFNQNPTGWMDSIVIPFFEQSGLVRGQKPS